MTPASSWAMMEVGLAFVPSLHAMQTNQGAGEMPALEHQVRDWCDEQGYVARMAKAFGPKRMKIRARSGPSPWSA